MRKPLKQWCAENNVSHTTGWRMAKKNQIPNAVQEGRNWFVQIDDPPAPAQPVNAQLVVNWDEVSPASVSWYDEDQHRIARAAHQAAASVRRNRAGTIDPVERFVNIDKSFIPFSYSSGTQNKSNLSIQDILVLCRKGYFNFPIVRNVVDVMTEFSVSNIFLTGGNNKSRTFFESLFKKINLEDFQDKFFREYYRSGNVFIFPFKGRIKDEDLKKLARLLDIKNPKASITVKYIILNPEDIQIQGSSSFVDGKYLKAVNDYELQRLRNPLTDQDQEVLKSLTTEQRKQIRDSKNTNAILIELDANEVYAVFYKKQDYEPFGVPLIFPVLDDIEWKSELKKIDKAITRTIQQAILLVTHGTEPDKGGVSGKILTKLEELFKHETVGRTIVSDWTTKAEFIIPDVASILDPKKYEIVNEDIRSGLNDILFGSGGSSEKFANQQIKVKVFVKRLKQARKAFLNTFLVPEIKKISKSLGFKSIPEPHFEDIDIDNPTEFQRIVTRLAEIGFLTPAETFTAIQNGRLPTEDESKESQQEFREQKDTGFYEPIVGGPFTKEKLAEKQAETQQKLAQERGRPPGSSRPQSTKRVSPIGASEKHGAEKIKQTLILAEKLENNIEKQLLKKHKLKKLNDDQKIVAQQITEIIISNEQADNWTSVIDKYIKEPTDTNKEQVSKIQDIASEHSISDYLASILYHSKV